MVRSKPKDDYPEQQFDEKFDEIVRSLVAHGWNEGDAKSHIGLLVVKKWLDRMTG